MMDRIAWSCTRATVRTGDEDLVRAALGNTGRDRAHARFGNEHDRYARAGDGVLQIEDELGQVLAREMSPIPGGERRVRAIHGHTLPLGR